MPTTMTLINNIAITFLLSSLLDLSRFTNSLAIISTNKITNKDKPIIGYIFLSLFNKPTSTNSSYFSLVMVCPSLTMISPALMTTGSTLLSASLRALAVFSTSKNEFSTTANSVTSYKATFSSLSRDVNLILSFTSFIELLIVSVLTPFSSVLVNDLTKTCLPSSLSSAGISIRVINTLSFKLSVICCDNISFRRFSFSCIGIVVFRSLSSSSSLSS